MLQTVRKSIQQSFNLNFKESTLYHADRFQNDYSWLFLYKGEVTTQ